jgi:hypothetical protein
VRIGDERRGGRKQEGVPVGRRSRDDLGTNRVAAPGRFSTTTCCPTALPNFSAIRRAMMSGVPPAAWVTTNRIGRSGQFCA